MAALRMLTLTLLLVILALPSAAQDTPKDEPKKEEPKKEEPKKPDPTLGLGKDLLKEIDDLSVEELLAKVARAQNMLSRDGQKLLKFRVRLEDAKKSADLALKTLDKDREIGRMQELFTQDNFKKELLDIATVKDKTEQATKLKDLLTRNGVSGPQALFKYANFKDAVVISKECEEGLAQIETEFAKTTPLPALPGGEGGADFTDVRAILDALKNRPPAPASASREPDLSEILKRLAQ
jgi:hypothetical protein